MTKTLIGSLPNCCGSPPCPKIRNDHHCPLHCRSRTPNPSALRITFYTRHLDTAPSGAVTRSPVFQRLPCRDEGLGPCPHRPRITRSNGARSEGLGPCPHRPRITRSNGARSATPHTTTNNRRSKGMAVGVAKIRWLHLVYSTGTPQPGRRKIRSPSASWLASSTNNGSCI